MQTSAAAAAFRDGNSPVSQARWQYIAVSWHTAGTLHVTLHLTYCCQTLSAPERPPLFPQGGTEGGIIISIEVCQIGLQPLPFLCLLLLRLMLDAVAT